MVSLLLLFELYFCSSWHVLELTVPYVKVKITSTPGKQFDSLVELCSGKFNVAPCHDLEGNLLKLPNTTMTPLLLMII
jgi:hypothetical protein